MTNQLIVSGEPDSIERFFAAIDGGFDSDKQQIYIDFNKIKPMPEALNIESGSRSNEALELYVEYLKELADAAELSLLLSSRGTDAIKRRLDHLSEKQAVIHEKDPDLFSFGEKVFANLRDYGTPTWCEWRIENWGTKWNAANQTRIDEATIQFDTAWSGVPELMLELSRQHPAVVLSYKYAEERWGANTGEFVFSGGQCLFDQQPYDHSPDANAITEELLGSLEAEDASDKEPEDDDWEQGDD